MDQLLKQRLSDKTFTSILEVTTAPSHFLRGYCALNNVDLLTLSDLQVAECHRHFSLAIVHSLAPPAVKIPVLVGTLKNILAEQIWIVVPQKQDWLVGDYLALGLLRDKNCDHPEFLSYSYNLDTYNHKRSWNNPRFWANPEQWRHRF